jgi:hypothetical protein
MVVKKVDINPKSRKQTKSSWWLYALKIERGKYYLSITPGRPGVRMKQQFDSFVSAGLIKRGRTAKLVYSENLGLVTKASAEVILRKFTRKYMMKYGMSKVRGGNTNDVAIFINRVGWVFDKDDWKMFKLSLYFAVLFIALLITILLIK